jgi:hypothetical protein
MPALAKNYTVIAPKLHREINLSYRRISKDAYQRHIRRLISSGKVERYDTQSRGCLVSYFLTEKAKKQISLKFVSTDPEQDKLRFLYLLILVFTQQCYYEFTNEEQFNRFLSSLHISRENLYIVYDGKDQLTEIRDEFIKLKIYRSKDGKIDIVRKEYMPSPSRQNNSIGYHCAIRGITEKMIFVSKYRPAFWHIGFTSSEIKRTFESLRDEGILKPAYLYDAEIIYEIADKKLDALLHDCYILYTFFSYNIVEYQWKYVRRPKQKEIDWLETFEGKVKVDRIRNEAYFYRKRLQKGYKRKIAADNRYYPINLNELADKLRENHKQTIRKYEFIADEIISLICPSIKK